MSDHTPWIVVWFRCLMRGHLWVTFAEISSERQRTYLARCAGCGAHKTFRRKP